MFRASVRKALLLETFLQVSFFIYELLSSVTQSTQFDMRQVVLTVFTWARTLLHY